LQQLRKQQQEQYNQLQHQYSGIGASNKGPLFKQRAKSTGGMRKSTVRKGGMPQSILSIEEEHKVLTWQRGLRESSDNGRKSNCRSKIYENANDLSR
jgi:hypothetical protein